MGRTKHYENEVIDRKKQAQDDWYLQRRREIAESEVSIARKGDDEKNNFPPFHLLGEFPEFVLRSVQNCAWDIVKGDADVRNTLISLQHITAPVPEDELAQFFKPGGYAVPVLSFKKMPNAASTPVDLGDEPRKSIQLGLPYKDPKNFTGAVIHYLHEINHYIDMWYSSDAASDTQYQGTWGKSYEDNLERHPDFIPGERSRGIHQRLVLDNNRPALTIDEQQSALSELLNDANADMIAGLISEEPVQPEDTGREKKLKEDYKKWREKHLDVDPGTLQLMKQEYIDKIRKKLARDAKRTYSKWGTKINPDQTVSATKIELGYVFEKQAYGFHTPGDKTGAWLHDFNKKFEAKFSTYLDPYKALLSFPVFRKSDSISQPGDAHEIQADSIARKVIGGEKVSPGAITPVSPSPQSKSEDSGMQTTPEFSDQLSTSKGSGTPLDGGIKTEMESGLGTSLDDVRVHTGSTAHTMSESINAKAFTHGQDIYFKNGNYDTTSAGGKELLAHELVHTQQQKGGISRKIQRDVSTDDAKTIHDQLTPHLFRIGELKRNSVLRILSAYTAEEITKAWQSDPMAGDLEVFVDSFRRVKDFDEFTVALVATFLALTEDQRVSRIQNLTGDGIISADNAVRILYLMQQLSSDHLSIAFSLDKDHVSPTKFDSFRMALPPAEAERITLAYGQSRWQEQKKDTGEYALIDQEVENTAAEVRRILGITTQITAPGGKKRERNFKKLARETENEKVPPLKAIEAYKEIQKLYDKSPEMEEEFGFRYPDLYAKVMENLPIEFMRSPEFGMQTVHVNEQDKREQIEGYDFLYSFAKPYRFLFNHPQAFANIVELEGSVKSENQQLNGIKIHEDREKEQPIAKKDLFEHRRAKITKERDDHVTMLADAKLYLKAAIPDDFVSPVERPAFETALDNIFARVRMSPDPMLSNDKWIYLPDGYTVNQPYILQVLINLYDDQLKEEESTAQSPLKEQYVQALEYRRKNSGIDEVLIGAPLPKEGEHILADELEKDENLLVVYHQQRGIFDVIHDEDNWKGTVESNNNLAIALTVVVQSGLGPELAAYINSRKIPMTLPGAPENESILTEFGFVNGTYTEKEGTKWENETLTSPSITAKRVFGMLRELVNDQLAAMYPEKKNKVANWSTGRKLLAFLVHPKKSLNILRSGIYFGEGFLPPGIKKNIAKRAHYEDLDLVAVQNNMGGQIYGMEFGSDDAAKNHALLNIDVNERKGEATIDSPILSIKSMNMEYPDMLFKSGPGQFIQMGAHIVWPPDPFSDGGSTTMFFNVLELTQIQYKDKESTFTIGRLHIDKLVVRSDKPIANYEQMNNWYKLFFSVMQFIQDILTLLMSGIQVSAQKFAPDMIEKMKRPGADPRLQNPERTLSDFLLQRLSEDQQIIIGYLGLKIEDMFFSDMGHIASFETGQGGLIASNYLSNSTTGEREMYFGFSGEKMMINGAAISDTMEANKFGAEKFGLDMFFNDPSGGKLHGRDLAGAVNFSDLTSGDQFAGVSKLKRMNFELTDMTGTALNLIGFKMGELPFTGVKGSVEFFDEVKKQDNVDAKPPMAKVTLEKVTNCNFLGLPYPADMSLRLISTTDSKMQGDIENAVIWLTLNSEADQQMNGWVMQEIKIETLTIPKLTGKDFSIITQGMETKVEEGGFINQVVLTNFVMVPNKDDRDEWDVTGLGLATGGVEMKGLGLKTAAGVTADLQSFTAGSLSFTMVTAEESVTLGTQKTTSYTFDATNVTTTGKIGYTSPQDPYDQSKKPITVGADLTMTGNDLHAGYTTTSIDGVTTGSTMTLKSKIDLISIPSLNVTSEKMKITAPEVADKPILLDNIDAEVEVMFDAYGSPTEFMIKSLIIETTTTHGLLITNLKNKRNLVDLPETAESKITKFYITDLKMKTRKFTQFEIDEMKRDKERKQLPDENSTWDFNQDSKGLNRIGLKESDFPEGMKLAIGDHIGVEMKQATSGEIYFDFVTINEFSYSITNLDAQDVIIKDDGKQVFKGDLDSETATGSYKMEVIGVGLDAKKKTTITGKINIPEITVHQLLIESDTSLLEIPADATKTSSIKKLVADYSVVITGPSENEKAAIKAEADAAKKKLESKVPMAPKKRKELEEIAKKEAKSEVVMTINSLTMEKLEAYGLHIKNYSKTDVVKSKSPGGKDIETYDSKKYEIQLHKDQAATVNNLTIEAMQVTIPKEDEKKVVMSATKIEAGGKKNEAGEDIPGIDIGTAEIFTSSVKHLLQGMEETAPKVTNTPATASLRVKKLNFGGSTDGAYTITIDNPEFWFPPSQSGQSQNVGIHAIEYDLDKTDEWSGAPSIKSHTDTQILLNDLQTRKTPVFSAKSIVISRSQVLNTDQTPKLDKNGQPIFERTIKIVDPILAEIDIKIDMNNNNPGQVHDYEIIVGGDMTGTTLILEQDEANFDEFKNTAPDRKMESATVLRTENADSEVKFSIAKFIINKNAETPRTDTENQALPEDDWQALNQEDAYEPTGKYDFLDQANGTITIWLYGTPIETQLEAANTRDGERIQGLIDMNNVMTRFETIMEGTNTVVNDQGQTVQEPRARRNPGWAFTEIEADFDGIGNYVLQNSGLDVDSMILVPNSRDNVLWSEDGRPLMRLSAFLDYQFNKPPTRPAAPGSNADLAQRDLHDMLNGEFMQLAIVIDRVTIDTDLLFGATSQETAEQRGWLGIFTEEVPRIDLHGRFDLNQTAETDPNTWNTKKLGPQLVINSPKLPAFRQPLKKEDKVNAVVSGTEINATSMALKFDEINLRKMIMEAKDLKIKGFRYEQKKQ